MRKSQHSFRGARAGLFGACVAFLCLASAADAATKLYKWVDAQGVTHWSDTPVDGAKKVDVPPAQSYSAPPAPRVSAPSAPATKRAPTEPANGGYTRLEIVQPTRDETFANVQNVEIAAALEPSLSPVHDPWIVLDGKRVQNGTSVIVPALRGTHSVYLEIEDASGKIVATSPTVTFHVLQPSIQTPPRGPALNKPKKP